MIIKCKASNRFLGKIDTETLFNRIHADDISIRVEFVCKKCGLNEIYDVYKDRYVHVKSYKNKKSCNIFTK